MTLSTAVQTDPFSCEEANEHVTPSIINAGAKAGGASLATDIAARLFPVQA